jgi:glucose-1-phosphate thymidylyltransferase
MNAIVLAGGYATRLWPITKDRPKMFLPIGDSTVIDRIFDALEGDDRIEDVLVSTNERFADAFDAHLAESPYDKPRLTVEETSAEDEKFGVVGALAQLVERESLSEDTLVIAGDNVVSFDVSAFLDYFQERGTPVLAAYDVGSREKAASYGLVELEGDRVVDFQEKPEKPQSTLVSIACYGLTAETLPLLEEYLADGNNPDEPGWFIQWLQARQAVYAYAFEDAWFDIGTPESYLDAVAWHLDGENRVHPDATLEDTTVGENVHVMADAEVQGSHLDRSVVFEEATIADADVRDSIVDEHASIEDVDLAGSLVGAYSQITSSGRT